MLTRPRRLATWLGAGVIIVVGAPIAYATDGGVQSHVPLPGGHSAPPVTGGPRDASFPTVGYLLVRNGDVMTVLYRETPIRWAAVGDHTAGDHTVGYPKPGF